MKRKLHLILLKIDITESILTLNFILCYISQLHD